MAARETGGGTARLGKLVNSYRAFGAGPAVLFLQAAAGATGLRLGRDNYELSCGTESA